MSVCVEVKEHEMMNVLCDTECFICSSFVLISIGCKCFASCTDSSDCALESPYQIYNILVHINISMQKLANVSYYYY